MDRSFIRSYLALGTLATGLGLGTVTHASLVEEVQIPSQLVSTPEPDDPNGACSKCRVNSLQAAQDATKDGATLELYYDDERGDFLGLLELTILLDDGTYVVETVEAVDLQRGEISVLELPVGDGWSWRDDVLRVCVEAVRDDG